MLKGILLLIIGAVVIYATVIVILEYMADKIVRQVLDEVKKEKRGKIKRATAKKKRG